MVTEDITNNFEHFDKQNGRGRKINGRFLS